MGSDLGVGSVFGGYRLEAMAGRGGMGVVYRARQLTLDRTVALKLLAPELAEDDEFRERFQRESRLLAATDHPNVVTVHEAGEHEGRLYIVMRYIAGTDLRRLIRDSAPLDPERVAALAAQLASALDAAHALGLIHRDVKPANVLIEERGGREHAYLADFGLTKPMASTTGAGGLTATGAWVGTADYVAPEQVTGGPVDGRADVYSLGCVLYTALTGHAPFERDTEIASIFAHVNDPPPSLAEHAPGLPEELDGALRRAMAKQPEERFPTAGELAAAVSAGLRGEAPQPSPATPTVAVRAKTTVLSLAEATAASPAGPTAARRRPRSLRLAALAAGVLAAAAIVAVALSSGGGSGEKEEGDALAAKRLNLEPIEVGPGAASVAIGSDSVWVSNSGGGTIRPIAADSGVPGRRIEVGESPGSLTVANGSVFVAASNGRTVARVSESDDRLEGSPARIDTSEAGELAEGDGFVFVTSLSEGSLTKLDPDSGKILGAVPAPDPGLDGPLAVGDGSVWIATNGDLGHGDRGYVSRIDARSLRPLAQVDLGPGSAAAGLAFGEGALWVADWNKNVVHEVDPRRNEVERRVRVPSGISSDDIAVGGGAVWVASTGQDQVVRIDPSKGRVVGRPTPVPASRDSELAVGFGSAWLSNPAQGTVTRIDY